MLELVSSECAGTAMHRLHGRVHHATRKSYPGIQNLCPQVLKHLRQSCGPGVLTQLVCWQAVRARTGAWQQVTSDIAAAQAAALLLQEPARRRVLAEAAQVGPTHTMHLNLLLENLWSASESSADIWQLAGLINQSVLIPCFFFVKKQLAML